MSLLKVNTNATIRWATCHFLTFEYNLERCVCVCVWCQRKEMMFYDLHIWLILWLEGVWVGAYIPDPIRCIEWGSALAFMYPLFPNYNKFAFSFLRRCKHDTARICCWPPCCCWYGSIGGQSCCRRAVQQIAIDWNRLPPGPQQQTSPMSQLQRKIGTERQTNGHRIVT